MHYNTSVTTSFYVIFVRSAFNLLFMGSLSLWQWSVKEAGCVSASATWCCFSLFSSFMLADDSVRNVTPNLPASEEPWIGGLEKIERILKRLYECDDATNGGVTRDLAGEDSEYIGRLEG